MSSFFVPTQGDLTAQESPPPETYHPSQKKKNAVEILLTQFHLILYRSKASFGIQQRLKFPGFSTKFYTGRLRPEVQLHTLSYTIFDRKGTPSYTFSWQLYLFHILSLELCIPLNCCTCTVFKI